jgi:hypothetical protein
MCKNHIEGTNDKVAAEYWNDTRFHQRLAIVRLAALGTERLPKTI